MNRRRRLLLGLMLLLPALGHAQARGQESSQELMLPGLRPLGAGDMRWFGLNLYRAQLWVAGERFDADAAFALQLTYARDFSGEMLVSTSIDEIRRLGMRDEATLARWRQELDRVLPSVKKGETLIGRHEPGRGMSMFHDGRFVGEVRDPALARAFFGIWLDPRTRAAELRTRLIGAG